MLEIRYNTGRTVVMDSLDAAFAAILAEYPDAVCYDDAGFEVLHGIATEAMVFFNDVERILCWENARHAEHDDGQKAIASIRQRN